MIKFEQLANLYSDFLFGENNHQQLIQWADNCLINEEDNDDENIILLSSSNGNEETVELTRKILKSVSYLETIEVPTEILLNNVKTAFPLHPLPEHITDDDSEYYNWDAHEVSDNFKNKQWDMAEPFGYALIYFTAEAFVYYLPAYLINIITHKNPKTNIEESVFDAFSSDPDCWDKKRQQILSYLSDYQKRLILAVLREVGTREKNYVVECKNIQQRLNIENSRLY